MAYNMIDSIKTEMKIRRELKQYKKQNPDIFPEVKEYENLRCFLISIALPFLNMFINMLMYRAMNDTLKAHPIISFLIVSAAYVFIYYYLGFRGYLTAWPIYLLGIFIAASVVGAMPERSGLGYGIYLVSIWFFSAGYMVEPL